MKERQIAGLDFTDFPDEITLVHGIDGEREWYECWKGKRKGIVIQRGSKTRPFYIFFIDGEAVRTYVSGDLKTYWNLEDAIEELKKLGFKVKVENESRMPS